MLLVTSHKVRPRISKEEAKVHRPLLLLALGTTIAVAVGGCSASVSTGGKELKQSVEVAAATKVIDKKLTDLPATKSVDCDSGVDLKAGTKFRCTATFVNGQTATLPYVVSSVNGDTASIDFDPDVANQAGAVDVVYREAALQGSAPVKSVSCPADAPGKPGSTITCKATLATGQRVEVTIALAPGGNMSVVNVR